MHVTLRSVLFTSAAFELYGIILILIALLR